MGTSSRISLDIRRRIIRRNSLKLDLGINTSFAFFQELESVLGGEKRLEFTEQGPELQNPAQVVNPKYACQDRRLFEA